MKTLLVCALVVGGACSRAETVPSTGSARVAVAPPAPMPPDAAPPVKTGWDGNGDFELLITEFHFETGTQMVRIDGQGHIDDVMAAFKEVKEKKETVMYRYWRRANYTASPDEIADLRKRLVTAEFSQLAKQYKGDNGDDGVTTGYRLTAGGKTFETSAYGTSTHGEPPALFDVIKWVRSEQQAHDAERTKAPTLKDADYDALSKQWGVKP